MLQPFDFFLHSCRTDIPWNDFRPCASWRGTLKTPAAFCGDYDSHPVFGIPGLNPLAINLDILHTWDLGISLHLLGSFLWDLLEESEEANRDLAWEALFEEIQSTYASQNVPSGSKLGRLKWKDLAKSKNEYPMLKHVKGRRVRHFVPVALEIAANHKNAACVNLVSVSASV